jgi:hypothetical protein
VGKNHEAAHYAIFFLSFYFLFLQSGYIPQHPVLEQYLNICSDFNARDEALQPHKKTGRIHAFSETVFDVLNITQPTNALIG